MVSSPFSEWPVLMKCCEGLALILQTAREDTKLASERKMCGLPQVQLMGLMLTL